jgi:hypothetical protein
MSDLTLHELKLADQKRLDDLLRKESLQMFGPTPCRIGSIPRKDRQPKIHKGFLAFLAPFRKFLRTS